MALNTFDLHWLDSVVFDAPFDSTLEPSGIMTGEVFGAQSFGNEAAIVTTGIASAEGFGVPNEIYTAHLAGIASEGAFGSPRTVRFILPSGIALATTTLAEYYNAGDNQYTSIYGVNWRAQTFTTASAYTIASVFLKLYRTLSPGTVTVSIRATAAGLPSGGDLCSGTTDGNALATSAEWKEITFGAGCFLSDATQYAIVVRATDGDVSNYVNWRYLA